MQRSITPYPFAALEVISASAQRTFESARRRLGRVLDGAALERILSELVGDELRIALRGIKPGPGRLGSAAQVLVEFGDSGVSCCIKLEPELAVVVLSRLLERPLALGGVGAPLDATLSGALSALVLEALRRAGGNEAPRLRTRTPAEPPAAVLQATLVVQGRPFEIEVGVALSPGAPPIEPVTRPLDQLVLEVSVPVVVGLSLATPGELEKLTPGSAWLFGDGSWIDPSGRGHAVLAAPESEAGVVVELWPDGKTVLRGELRELAFDVEASMQNAESESKAALAEAVLDTPVVVRVELGAVSLLARDFAKLRPGDVIETGRRVAEPVVLRVAGREVARGELVNIEGELGVRIQKLSDLLE